jgi:hypothetical protein
MRTLNDYFLTVDITDISTEDQMYVVAPDEGKIIKIMAVLNDAISGADADLTVKIDGVAVTGGVLTVPEDGSASGDVVTVYPTGANHVLEGSVIEVETDGASTGTARTAVTLIIRR